ncbi:MAG: hypothetical protein P1Q69_12345 [Candidatus Thorarchaeota archaeon]|nr:hypothetical protein [Candidatus Thorarchaeota archaeon]
MKKTYVLSIAGCSQIGSVWKFDSAAGPTREEIRLSVIDTTNMASYGFSPQEGLTTEVVGTGVIATWTLEEFTLENSVIRFDWTQQVNVIKQDYVLVVIIMATGVGLVIFSGIVIRKR